MNGFVLEALFIGSKEGAKLALCFFLLFPFIQAKRLDYLKRPLALAVIVVLGCSFAVMRMPVTPVLREMIIRMTGYVFGLFYLLSIGTLYHTTGTDMLGPLRKFGENKAVLGTAVFVLAGIYFVPDMAGASLYLADLSTMAGKTPPVLAAAAAGFCGALALGAVVIPRIKIDIPKLFGLPQLFLFAALIKLAAGGVHGFAELSLIPAVQAGLMKLVHDMVHQTFLLIMVPDHMILTATAWNFIGIFFGKMSGLLLSLVIMTAPLVIFLAKHFSEQIAVPLLITGAARRRIFVRAVRDQRMLKSIPVVLFLIYITATWFAQSGQAAARLYLPEPIPVVPEQGMLSLPLQSPGSELRDGAIHKFTVTIDGENARFLILKKPDGTLAVCLDACEICPPDGYGQAREHVVCTYCNTPIPFDTLGKPGGCNPIPLESLVTEKDVRIRITEIAEKWKKVKTGAAKEEPK